MRLYHGSDQIVSVPRILAANRFLDFGEGFYTTTSIEQASRWAQRVRVRNNTLTPFVSVYEMDEAKMHSVLRVMQFTEPNETWLDFICACRSGKPANADYDLVIGPVADDNVYATVKLFETGILTRQETVIRLKVESLFDQVLFHTDAALAFCRFISAHEVTDHG